ncbi:aminoacyl-histidine dipeptidase [Zeaxanthinibacter enoshimensis]|uniref:Cytosol non-specific dipeptidase n=1 Tax=Zeaxanthinibacter enoshimensis TaxID=392009 RepID=A0A4R6TKH0_9FLAO|nr:aminoacyl-histidine dipeptidase [Zeaxanthinibacter enoshimensis]TDQ29322.1 dipeptidase D [Zeaxanthinibacter enoshimensis]
MNESIKVLEPAGVWKNFAKLNEVPRPSKKEERVIAFMMEFGRSLELETFKDSVGNVIIRKPATEGMEDRPMVILQSHLDMVHQKNADTRFDFEKEGIRMKVAGEWVKAEGTTLGADNGMGVAAIMALLESTDIPHPPLEALFTIDEETGMTGAKGLEAGTLEGEILLNLDTEEDDEIDIGCAGGVDITASCSYEEEESGEDDKFFQVVVRGLQGGHSGMDIDKGLGNANKIMNRVLNQLWKALEIRISDIQGGGLRNAIPRESKAIIAVPGPKAAQLEAMLNEITTEIATELTVTEPGLKIEVSPLPGPVKVMNAATQEKLLKMISAAHNGVYTMSAAFEGLVESSNNIARVEVNNGKLEIGCLTRSSVESVKTVLADSLKAVFELGGCNVTFSGEYPGWTPDPDSRILKVLEDRYTALFEEQPRVVACHAGLECGIIGNTFPDLDMISFGPTIRGAHSPDERVHIASVKKFWTFLLDVLRHIPKK